MKKTILGLLLAFSLMGSAWAEVDRSVFTPDGTPGNVLKDIPAARNLGSGQQAEKLAVSIQGSLPAYLEKSNLDTAVHRATDFSAASGNQLSSGIQPQSAWMGGGKKVVSANKLNPIDL